MAENYGHHNDSLVNDMLLQKLQLAHDVEVPPPILSALLVRI